MKACTVSNALGTVGKESKVAVAMIHLLSLLYKSTTTIPPAIYARGFLMGADEEPGRLTASKRVTSPGSLPSTHTDVNRLSPSFTSLRTL